MQTTEIDHVAEPVAAVPPGSSPEPLSLAHRIATLIVILVPPVGLVGAIVLVWGYGVDWLSLVLFAVMYSLTGLGVTMGFHRFFTHKSFDTSRVIQAILAVLGSMAVEGPILRWVATHRCHHQHSDADHDPHSPHTHGAGFLNMLRGLWRAHVGWMFEPFPETLARYVADLRADRLIRAISALFPLWVALGLLVPGVAAGAITGSWTAFLLGVLWGGLVRVCIVHHLTWSINSVCHIWGTRPFETHDQSRNNPFFGVIAFGEGWHNNHHAFPTSARHGLRWWELDVTYLVVRLLSLLGLTWNVKVPSPARVAAKAR